MPNKPSQFYAFLVQPFDAIKEALLALDLQDFDAKKGTRDWYLQRLEKTVRAELVDSDFILYPPERAAIRMLSTEHFQKLVGANVGEELFTQIRLVSAVFGISPTEIIPYPLEEFRKLYLEDEKGYDSLRVVRTLREHIADENGKELAEDLVQFLIKKEGFIRKKTFTWEEAFFFVLIIHSIYSRFDDLREELQKAALQMLYFRAVAAGVPVGEAVQAALARFVGPLNFAVVSTAFADSIQKNLEFVPVPTQIDKEELFADVVGAYMIFAKDKWNDASTVKTFVDGGYRVDGFPEAQAQWFEECLALFVLIKSGTLVRDVGAELTESELYFNDMVQLLVWFGIGKFGAADLVKYFMTEGHRVPLEAFLKKLSEVGKLEEQVTVDSALEVTAALHESGLLPKEREIIVFHEDDGTFHWNN